MINGGRKDILNILDLKSLKEPYYIVNLAGLQYTGITSVECSYGMINLLKYQMI
jgi:hypothetical protein